MDTVLIELPHAASGPPGGPGLPAGPGRPPRPDRPTGRPRLLRLGAGDVATFGRGTPEHPVDVPISDPGVSRLAGRVVAVGDYWLLTNLSRDKTYVVENPEGAGEHLKVPPGRLDAPVPFEFSRVVLPLPGGTAAFKVYAPQHGFADPHAWPDPAAGAGGEATAAAFSLDETSKYFLVLVALCEPRLRDLSAAALPTVEDVLRRLRPLPGYARLSRSAVNHHLEYVATTKLRLKLPHGSDDAERLSWKREAVVSLALRFDLVREEHLALLPSRRSLSADPAAALGRG